MTRKQKLTEEEVKFVAAHELLHAVMERSLRTCFSVEYTDTFGGEANYSWVKRADLSVPFNPTNAIVMRAAKKAMGLTNVRGRVTDHGDTIEFRPYGLCTVMFITFY